MLEQFHYDSDLIGGSLMVRESRLGSRSSSVEPKNA